MCTRVCVCVAASVILSFFFLFLHLGDAEHSLPYDNRISLTSGNEDKKMTRACMYLCLYTYLDI